MQRISRYIISLFVVLIFYTPEANSQTQPADSVILPLKMRVGFDLIGPTMYIYDNKNLNLEGYFSVDLGEKTGLFLGTGYSDFYYSQYNYEYMTHGFYIKAGVDINLFKADKSQGKYWAGLGIRYGLSSYLSETPFFKHDSYWGTTEASIPSSSSIGHFLELAPGFRAEIFDNFSMGWSINLRALIYNGTGKDLRPIYFPGFGKGDESVSFGINYFLSWNIPYKKIKISLKKEEPEDIEEQEQLLEPGEAEPPSLFTPAEYP